MSAAPGPAPPAPGAGGDLQRTRLAAERTLLAWLRSALAALAVGLTVARVVPELADEPRGRYVALGTGYCLLGLALAAAGAVRYAQLSRRPESPLGAGGLLALGVAVAALGAATLLVLLAD